MPFIDLSSPNKDDQGGTPAGVQPAPAGAPPQSTNPRPSGSVPAAIPPATTTPPATPTVPPTDTGGAQASTTDQSASVVSGGITEVNGPSIAPSGAPAPSDAPGAAVPEPKPTVQGEPAPVLTDDEFKSVTESQQSETVMAPASVATPATPAPTPTDPTSPPAVQPNDAGKLPPLPGTENAAGEAVNLSGTAKGKEAEVSKILKQADTIQKENTKQKLPPSAGGLKPQSAGEKFYADRANIEDFLNMAEERNASDLHLSSEYPPMLRIDGKLVPLGSQNLTNERAKALFTKILRKDQQKKLNRDLDVDFSYSHKTGTRFRVNIFYKKGKLAGAFRLIPSRIRTVAELGLPEVLYDFAKTPQGLILVTGPTGHGKSTTIASMIQEVNLNEAKHIITLEDPIEYVFPKAKALVDQREIGTDVKSFKRALRAALREDPDVVLVGEMRDFETIASTITVAETGHLVFSTLHTNSAAQSMDRVIDVFPDAQQAQIRAQLANVIKAVISQRLVPISKGGRKAVIEIMIATPAIKNAIREGKTYQIDNMIQTNAEVGMVTLEKSLIELVRKGDLTVEEAQSHTTKPDELLSLMKAN